MKTKIKIFAVLAAILGIIISPVKVFAANPYGIEYSGGEPLGASNLQINPTLIDGLMPIMTGTRTIEYSNSPRWQRGYAFNGCRESYYFTVNKNNPISSSSGLSMTMIQGQYTVNVQFVNVVIDDIYGTWGDKDVAILSHSKFDGGIHAGWGIYSNPECSGSANYGFNASAGINVYVEMKIAVYDNGKPLSTDQLYFAMTDIDAAQSFKILNSDNLLSPSNMYAKSDEALLPTDPSITLRNMYVANGNYIYSQGAESGRGDGFNIVSGGNVYAKLNTSTLSSGLDVVYGFSVGAGAGINLYAKQFDVKYIPDKKGIITGITEEKIISGQNPSGSTTKPTSGNEFKNWIADKDITLTNGTIIKAGQPITPEQIKQVVVNDDIVFTAIHTAVATEAEDPEISVPNTGESTSKYDAILVSIPIIGVSLGALLIGLLPRLAHKKVDFDK